MNSNARCNFAVSEQGEIVIKPIASWRFASIAPACEMFRKTLQEHSDCKRVRFDASALATVDSSFLNFLMQVSDMCQAKAIELDKQSLPAGAARLLELAAAVPSRAGAARSSQEVSLIEGVGIAFLAMSREVKEFIIFLGALSLVFLRFLKGQSIMRRRDVLLIIQECGPHALPIVTLISILVGLILAFIGAVQLAQFGAQIYVANLVGIAMLREMGAVMAAVIVAGRTGAAFAAEIGTMEVNEEIDALKTFGICPLEFLVLPRMIALVFMLPLLCIYADILGILGGAIVAVGALDLSAPLYWQQTWNAVSVSDLVFGVVKSAVFGLLIAIAGCLRGIQAGRTSAAVGLAATSAVVTSLVLVVIVDAAFAIVGDILGV